MEREDRFNYSNIAHGFPSYGDLEHRIWSGSTIRDSGELNMKLVTFTDSDTTRIGIVVAEEVVDLAAAAPDLPREMRAFLEAGRPALEAAAEAGDAGEHRIALSEVHLEAPVRPSKCLAIGFNYAEHIEETGRQRPDFPTFFNKQVSCITGPSDPIHLPRVSERPRLRGRARLRDREALPPRSQTAGGRGDRRLHRDERRERAGLAVQGAHHDARQVLRHPRPAGTLDRHPRGGRGPPLPGSRDPGERRAPPELQHQASDLRLLRS